jgi:isoleucyl-tRNA synthetase
LTHRYPVCWRCGQELVYRLVKEWFLSTNEIRPLMLEAVDTVSWSPSSMKARMKDWLKNMGDWCISRKRFWGLPLPFYECQSCGYLQVFDRIEKFYKATGFETEETFRQVVPDLHRPYLDDLTIPCPKCGNAVHRIPDVGDCWLDAGIVPFSSLNFLQDNSSKSYWAKWFPADFVVEMREQIRLWFYSLLFMSVTLTGKAPYKAVQAYETVLDEKGIVMHRSTGNALWFHEAAEAMGVDQNRWFYAGWDLTKPLLYGFNNVKESMKPFHTFWSCTRFLQQNLILSPFLWENLKVPLKDINVTNVLDAWFIVKLESLSNKIDQEYSHFNVQNVVKLVSQFWEEVSHFWLRNSRKRFWEVEESKNTLSNESSSPYQLLWNAIFETLQFLGPIVPHVSEYLYQVLVLPVAENLPESLHLNHYQQKLYPKLNSKFQNAVNQVPYVWKVLELGRQIRHDSNIKNRYQLPNLWVTTKENNVVLDLWENVFKMELNVEKMVFSSPTSPEKYNSASDGNMTCWLEIKVSDENKKAWYQSDILRTVQFLRKRAKLPLTRLTEIVCNSDDKEFLEYLLTSQFRNVLKKEAFVMVLDFNTPVDTSWFTQKVKGVKPHVYVSLKQIINN